MKSLPALALSAIMAFTLPATVAHAQAVPPAVSAQIVPGANLTALSASTGLPVSTLVAEATRLGFTTTSLGAGAAAGAGGLFGGLGTGGALAGLGVVVVGAAIVAANNTN